MLLIRIASRALVLCLLTLGFGCTGSQRLSGPLAAPARAAQPVAPPAGLTLPRPNSLLANLPRASAARQASYVNNDLGKDGADWDPLLPNQFAVNDGKSVELTPNYSGAGADIGGLAFCTYHFTAPGYDRNAQIRLGWSLLPADLDSAWIGLARWDANRWDFYPSTSSGITDLPYIEPYFTLSGDLLLVLVRMGTDVSIHDEVRLGGPGPVADIVATPLSGDLPLTTTLDASGSNPVEGAIVKYEWDVDGDGTYDADSGTTPTLDWSYTANGTYQATVRVTNDFNAKDTESVPVQAIGYWQHSLGYSKDDSFHNAAVDSMGNIYAVGSSNAPSGPAQYNLLLCKWSPTGVLEWAKTFDGGADDVGLGVAVDSGGYVIVCGHYTHSGNREALVQKWTPNGVLSWSKYFGAAGSETASGLVVDGTDIYAGGDTANASTDIFVCRLTSSGTLDWAQVRDKGGNDKLTSMSSRWAAFTGTSGLILAAEAVSAGDPNIWKLEYSLDGGFDSGALLGPTDTPKRQGQIIRVHDWQAGETSYFIGGQIDSLGEWRVFAAKTDDSGAGVWGSRWGLIPTPNIYALCADGDGGVVLGGSFVASDGQNDGILINFSSIGTISAAESWSSGASNASCFGLQRFREGYLYAGSGRDALGSWEPAASGRADIDLGFVTAPGTGSALSWNSLPADGTVADAAASLTADSGGGVADALLAYRGLLE